MPEEKPIAGEARRRAERYWQYNPKTVPDEGDIECKRIVLPYEVAVGEDIIRREYGQERSV